MQKGKNETWFITIFFGCEMEIKKRFIVCLSFGLFVYSLNSFVYAQGSEPAAVMTMTTSVTGVAVRGDKEKFEEDHWISRDVSGGLSDFSYSKEYKNGDSLEIGASGIAHTNDYFLDMDYEKAGVGSLKMAYKQFRKYYDGTGGFYSQFTPTAASPTTFFETAKNLHLDIGDFKLEGILSREDEPKYTFSLERGFREGSKSLLAWNNVVGAGGVSKDIYPNFMDIGQDVTTAKVGFEHTIKNVDLSAEQSWENARVKTLFVPNSTKTLSTGAFTVATQYDKLNYDLYSTILRFSKDSSKNVFSSLGFMYVRYVGGEMESATDTDTSSANLNRPPNPADIIQDVVRILPNVSFSPSKEWIMDAGFKGEFIRKRASSTNNSDFETGVGGSGVPDGTIDEFQDIKTAVTTRDSSEHMDLKYKGLKNAIFYTEADFQQKFIDQSEWRNVFGPDPRVASFGRITHGNYYDNNFKIGSKWYIFSNLDMTTEFRDKNEIRDFKHLAKELDAAGPHYPAFINSMDFTTYSPVLKLNYKPYRWISYNFGYHYDTTVYGVRTLVADSTEISKYRAHVYSLDVTVTPYDCFYVSVFYQRENAATTTRANGAGGSTAITIPTYNANLDVVGLTFSYAPDEKNTFTGSYSMSRADNFNDFTAAAAPLALGLDDFSQNISLGLNHKLTKNCSVDFKYAYAQYGNDTNNRIDNYRANSISTALRMIF